MPQIKEQAKLFRDWQGLIGNVLRNITRLPGAEPLVEDLASLLAEAQEVKLDQENETGRRKASTQRLKQLVDDGKEATRKLRAFIKTRFHSRAEELSQFGIPPSRSRVRKVVLTAPPKPPAGEGNPPAPEGSAHPPAPAGENANSNPSALTEPAK
jgi:hypothetical protein